MSHSSHTNKQATQLACFESDGSFASRRPPIGCTHCAARWGGEDTVHCPTCHCTLSDIDAFERHRAGPAGRRRCVNPESVGLVKVVRGYDCWGLA